MRKTLFVIAIGAMALAVSACAPDVTVQSAPAEGAPSGIAVNGVGRVTGTPDTLTMSFGVRVLEDSVAEAVAIAAERADAVIEALVNNGVAEEDIQTANYSIYPQYDWREDEQELVGYQVSNSVIAKIRTLDKAGEIIDDVTAAGGDEVTVSGVSFSIEDNEALIEAAREAAWEDALAKANQLADLSNITLGAPTTITESFSPASQPQRFYEESFLATDSALSTPIQPGEQQVNVSISVRFGIQS